MKNKEKQNHIALFLNSLLYNIFFIIWTILWGGMSLPLAICSKRLSYFIGYFWAFILLKALKIICNISYCVEGKDYIPKKTCIVAAKHESTWDTVFLLQYFYNPSFILKKELTYIPIFGWHLFALRMIYINRKQSTKALKIILEKAKNIIADGRKIIIFPQGTRTLPNEKKPYKSGIYAIAQQANLPVLPIALNSGNLWKKNAFMKYPGTITVKIMPMIKTTNNKQEFIKSLTNTIETNYQQINNSFAPKP